MQIHNPFISNAPIIGTLVSAAALRITRAAQASRALVLAHSLLQLVKQGARGGMGPALANRIHHVCVCVVSL